MIAAAVIALALGWAPVAPLPPFGVREAAATAQTNRQASVAIPNGADPAEIQAKDGRLGFHEQRKFPYGMVIFLVVLTVVGVISTKGFRSTPRRDAL